MKAALRMLTFCSLVFLLVYLPSGVSICQSQQQTEEFTTIDRISLHIDGSATWIVEKRLFLENNNATKLFMLYWSARWELELQGFANHTTWLVDIAKQNTGREMEAKSFSFDINILPSSLPGSYGILKYQCDWLGFAKIEDKRIVMGDAVWWPRHLASSHVFTVEYPSGYRVTYVSPLPDYEKESERVLKWYGDRTFSGNEPSVVFEERTFTMIDALIENLPIVVGGIAMISASFVGLWFYKSKRRKEMEVLTSSMSSPLEVKSEEDKVIELLKAAGGSSYQSTITKHCGFSKAKTSMLLTSMEIRGVVVRKKQGREKVVTLLEKS